MTIRRNGHSTPPSRPQLRVLPERDPLWKRLARIASRVSLIGILAGFVVGAATIAWTVARWEDRRASIDDVAAVGALVSEQDHRLIRIETDLGWIKQTLYSLAQRAGLSPAPQSH